MYKKITQIIFWLVKIGMTRNTLISLATKYTMAPGHQLHHLYLRAHLPFSQHQYLRVYWVLLPLKSHIQWRRRSGFPLPLSWAASLLAASLEALDLATREPRPSTSASVSTMTLTLGDTSDNHPQVKTLSSTLLTTNSLTYCLTSRKERAQAWANLDVMCTSGYATRQQSRALGIYSLIPKEISGTVCSTGLHEVKSGKNEIWNWPKNVDCNTNNIVYLQNASK